MPKICNNVQEVIVLTLIIQNGIIQMNSFFSVLIYNSKSIYDVRSYE